jgi:hypothetical protein
LQEAHHNTLNQLVVMDKWVEKHLEEVAVLMTNARRHGYKDSTRSISWHGSNNRAYLPMEILLKRGLRPAHPPKSLRGNGMTSMDTGSTWKRRTRRAWLRTVVFNMRASMRPLGKPRHTMGRLKRYENLTTVVTYRYPSSGANGSSRRQLSWTSLG